MEGYREGVNEAGGEFLDAETQYANATADLAVTAVSYTHLDVYKRQSQARRHAALRHSGLSSAARQAECGYRLHPVHRH